MLKEDMRTHYKNPAIHKAFNILETLSADDKVRRLAEIREKVLRNEISELAAAKREEKERRTVSNTFKKVQSLSLKQYTVFEKADFNFSSGINVFIGANSTGKTHVLKIMYTLLKLCETGFETKQKFENKLNAKLTGVFRINSADRLVRWISDDYATKGNTAYVHIGCEDTNFKFQIHNHHKQNPGFAELINEPKLDSNSPVPVYFPAQEVISINEGFIAAYNKRELPYDETYYDLSLALNALPLRKKKLIDIQDSIEYLQKIISGDYKDDKVITQQKGRFCFNLPEGEFEVHLVAEGYRKIATLLYLLKNGSLTKESILFWDEPEANLNPKLITQVVKVLKKLAASGMQIFIATHDYLLSHELSLLAEYPSDTNIDIRFFALHKPDRKAGVSVESGQTLAEIKHNPILEEFAAHYDRESSLFYKSENTDNQSK
ncbi:MAG: AAA family ATPase [Desulfobacterales bacterium]|nr:AAA family ATPase [Desulfobacterales bacterium]